MNNRYRDYVGFPPLLRSGENDGKSFSDFYRASQIELLSALDNVLSQKAEDTLTEFAAVKKADVQLQTQLGNRKGQIAANIIGAFAESQNSAFGWQVRVYGGENDSKGANAGIFFRRVDGESLYGVNTFADYEKGNYGEFLRYGIGGELQNRYASFAMNFYLPITDDKERGATVAFSQKGYDANLRINIPRLDFLQVAADYYHYDGKYGGEDDNGFRYGLELQPIANLRIGAYYDDGGEKFGGDIVYVYNIAAPAKRESKVAFSPDLFSPVVREYSQRIISTTTLQIEILRTPNLTTTMTRIIPAITTMITTGNFITLTTETTMAGLTTTMAITTQTMTATRMASVNFTTRIDNPNGFAGFVIATTGIKFLVTLPPASQTNPPIVLTINRNWRRTGALGFVVIMDSGTPFAVGQAFAQASHNFTLTVAQGSEDFISVAILVSITTEMETMPPITTETRMTNRAMPMTMTRITPEMTITTRITAFLTMTITLGLPTTNIGAANAGANIDSRLPPSFPLSFPQVPKLALAAIPHFQLSFPPSSRHSRAGGNQLPQGGEY